MEINEFADRHGVEFDMFSKIEVNGSYAHPLYKYLKSKLKGSMGKLVWIILLDMSTRV